MLFVLIEGNYKNDVDQIRQVHIDDHVLEVLVGVFFLLLLLAVTNIFFLNATRMFEMI